MVHVDNDVDVVNGEPHYTTCRSTTFAVHGTATKGNLCSLKQSLSKREWGQSMQIVPCGLTIASQVVVECKYISHHNGVTSRTRVKAQQ